MITEFALQQQTHKVKVVALQQRKPQSDEQIINDFKKTRKRLRRGH